MERVLDQPAAATASATELACLLRRDLVADGRTRPSHVITLMLA